MGKNFIALSDKTLNDLLREARSLLSAADPTVIVSATTLYWLILELLSARDEILRLQDFEAVESVLLEELDAEDDISDAVWITPPVDTSSYDEAADELPPPSRTNGAPDSGVTGRIQSYGESAQGDHLTGRRLPKLSD